MPFEERRGSSKISVDKWGIMLIRNNYLALVMVLWLVFPGCGEPFKKNHSKMPAMKSFDREIVRSVLKPLVGKYTGHLSMDDTTDTSYRVQLVLFIAEVPDGEDEKGLPRRRPELRAFYRCLDHGCDSVIEKTLMGRYYVETSSLTLVSLAGLTRDIDSVSFSGFYRKGKITGQLHSFRGCVGHLELQKNTDEMMGPQR